MKTVVKQLLDELLKEYPITMTNEILTNKQFWLDMEKKQIEDAYNVGESDGLNMAKYSDFYKYESGAEYYKSTYETDTLNAPIE